MVIRVIKHFVGGSNHETTTDNVTGFATKFTDGALLQNCTFTHYRHTSDYHNTSAVKTYQTHNLIVENCNISDCTGGIFLKSSGDTTPVRPVIRQARTATTWALTFPLSVSMQAKRIPPPRHLSATAASAVEASIRDLPRQCGDKFLLNVFRNRR